MRTKMNLNVVAETEEEKKIEDFLNVLHKSEEVKMFLTSMEEEAKRRNVYKYRARIKNVNSAIRTHRINKKKLDEVRDYVGLTFMTYTEEEINPIINYLKERLPNAEFIDFVAEEYIYSPLVYIKWVPPLGHNVHANEPLIPGQMNVPIEIRVCSREAYISEQSAYYSVQKNDTIKMPIEEKNKLRNLVQHITYKFALLNMRELNKEEEKHTVELQNLINENKEFLIENNDLCLDAILDFGRLIYRCEHEGEILEDEDGKSQEYIDKTDELLKKKFLELLKEQSEYTIENINIATQQLKKVDYKDIQNK